MRDGSGTKERIRREALALFVARGVDAVSVRDIAEAAEVRPSTLYVHWASREALIADLFITGYAEYGRRLAEIAALAQPFRARLAAMLRLICRLQSEDRALFSFLLLAQHEQSLLTAVDNPNPISVLHEAVAAATASGEIPAADPALITAAIVGIVVQAATFRHYGRMRRDLDAAADEIVALCLKLVVP